MSQPHLTRRAYLKLTVLGSTALGAAAMGFGCGGEDKPKALTCTDVTGLSDAEKTGRTAMQYIDKSPHADKTCANCSLYQAPAQAEGCGQCTILKGPIHPQGHCTAWAAGAAAS